jgi:hypothetical protein
MLLAAKSLALTAADLLLDAAFLEEVKREFQSAAQA